MVVGSCTIRPASTLRHTIRPQWDGREARSSWASRASLLTSYREVYLVLCSAALALASFSPAPSSDCSMWLSAAERTGKLRMPWKYPCLVSRGAGNPCTREYHPNCRGCCLRTVSACRSPGDGGWRKGGVFYLTCGITPKSCAQYYRMPRSARPVGCAQQAVMRNKPSSEGRPRTTRFPYAPRRAAAQDSDATVKSPRSRTRPA